MNTQQEVETALHKQLMVNNKIITAIEDLISNFMMLNQKVSEMETILKTLVNTELKKEMN